MFALFYKSFVERMEDWAQTASMWFWSESRKERGWTHCLSDPISTAQHTLALVHLFRLSIDNCSEKGIRSTRASNIKDGMDDGMDGWMEGCVCEHVEYVAWIVECAGVRASASELQSAEVNFHFFDDTYRPTDSPRLPPFRWIIYRHGQLCLFEPIQRH